MHGFARSILVVTLATLLTGCGSTGKDPAKADYGVAGNNPDHIDTGNNNLAELESLTAQIEERLKKIPDDGEGWALLASAKLRLGKMDEAQDALAKAKEFLPATQSAEATARFAQTLASISQGQLVSQIRQYAGEAIQLDPANGRAHTVMALLAMQIGDAELARKEWATIIERLPPNSIYAVQANKALDMMNHQATQSPK